MARSYWRKKYSAGKKPEKRIEKSVVSRSGYYDWRNRQEKPNK